MANKIYAFDFDGVICDSAIETGITGWRVARKLWADMPENIPATLSSSFRAVRPMLETGYEATLIMRLLFEGIRVERLLEAFQHQIDALLQRDSIDINKLKQTFGTTRDEWLEKDFSSWIDMNPLFNGIAEKLKRIDSNNRFIITTKQERFVNHILAAEQIIFPLDKIYGLDRHLDKQQILTNLILERPNNEILFIEDRLATLSNVIADDRLKKAKLFLADWGYNTVEDRDNASRIKRIEIISLSDIQSL